jgi:hypothetical protein
MKKIELTQNQWALVDDWWFDVLNQVRWQAQWNEQTGSYYAVRAYRVGAKTFSILMSNVVAQTPKGKMCDHINHNTLDNQEHNLRNTNNAQNQWNSKRRKDNKLGYKNIRVQKSGGFQVRIKANGKTMFDQTFKSLDDAISARDSATKKFHGNYAYTGEPQ